MTGIQILLVTGTLLLFFYYAFRIRSAVVDLLILAFFTGLAIFFILFPANTNIIARKLGVGRGADLLFYLCILFFLFVVLKLFARLTRLERLLTDFVRQQAKNDVLEMEEKK